jgi:acetyl-CoA carboxylase biotin carboxyl carrier protein
MSLSFEEVAELVRIIDASACEELILETAELKLVMRRRGKAAPEGVEDRRHGGAKVAIDEAAQSAKPVRGAAMQPASATGTEIRAPMVGTFYRAPSPNAAPFVELGAKVKKGQPLCIIEVMKLFTTIYADADGEVVSIGAENGELVEYGRLLFVLEEAR